MAEDIIALRTQVVTLEEENSQLRSKLSLHQDLGCHLLDDTDIDVMTKAEIADRIGKHYLSITHYQFISILQNEPAQNNVFIKIIDILSAHLYWADKMCWLI